MSNRSGGPGPPLFSVFCFSTRPPARHPEAARPPTYREIKNARPRDVESSGMVVLVTKPSLSYIYFTILIHLYRYFTCVLLYKKVQPTVTVRTISSGSVPQVPP